jgi:metal-responsive CopG/Arc/MetJ family transcriptional regulator
MAATNRPQVLTERVLITLTPQDLADLNAISAEQGTPRTETVRQLIRRATRREKREEPQ